MGHTISDQLLAPTTHPSLSTQDVSAKGGPATPNSQVKTITSNSETTSPVLKDLLYFLAGRGLKLLLGSGSQKTVTPQTTRPRPVTPPSIPNFKALATVSPEQIFKQSFKKADVVILGENHAIDDELFLQDYAAKLKGWGVRQVAIEWCADLQPELNIYLKTGKTEGLSQMARDNISGMPAYMKFARAAYAAGIKVVAIDQDSTVQDKDKLKREQTLADKIETLPEKSLVLLGYKHVSADDFPFKTVRSLLQGKGVKTAAVMLESLNSSRANVVLEGDKGQYIHHAYLEGSKVLGDPQKPIGFWTSALGTMIFMDPTYSPDNFERSALVYSQALDAVILLPKNLSPLTQLAKNKLGIQ